MWARKVDATVSPGDLNMSNEPMNQSDEASSFEANIEFVDEDGDGVIDYVKIRLSWLIGIISALTGMVFYRIM